MSNFRSEMSIPVTRDNRTFEQRRRDMLDNLGRRTSMRLEENPTGTTRSTHVSSDTTASSLSTDSNIGRPLISYHDDWDRDLNRWVTDSHARFNEETKQMRQRMFTLEPVDDFLFDPWRDMPSLGGDHDSLMAQMERRMNTMSQQMQSLGGLGAPRSMLSTGGPGGGSTMQSSSSSRITTSSTTSSGSDPRSMKTQSNVKESISQSRTVNGQTTGSSSHSSMSSTSKGPGAQMLTTSGGVLAELPKSPGGTMEFLKDAYELDEDGQVHFKVRFDAKDFSPEDIDVSTVDNRLTVSAKKSIKSGDTETDKSFSRAIELPQTIDHDNFQCNLTDDGILILDAPVKAPDYQALTFDNDYHLGIRPKSITEAQQSTGAPRTLVLKPTGTSGPTILKDGISGRKLHLEVPIDPSYKAEELCVRADANRIIVSGKQQPNSANGSRMSEFSRSYETPETVDPFTITAQLTGTTLIVEAPLYSQN